MQKFILHVMADYLIVPVVLIGGVAMLRIPKQSRQQIWGRAVLAGLVALLLAKTISLLYQGQRPFEILGVAPGAAFLPNPGFPSDHALVVFTVTFVVWASTKNKVLGLTLLTMSAIVALGRILALVHTPLDVLGGLACAFVAAAGVYGRRFFTTRL